LGKIDPDARIDYKFSEMRHEMKNLCQQLNGFFIDITQDGSILNKENCSKYWKFIETFCLKWGKNRTWTIPSHVTIGNPQVEIVIKFHDSYPQCNASSFFNLAIIKSV